MTIFAIRLPPQMIPRALWPRARGCSRLVIPGPTTWHQWQEYSLPFRPRSHCNMGLLLAGAASLKLRTPFFRRHHKLAVSSIPRPTVIERCSESIRVTSEPAANSWSYMFRHRGPHATLPGNRSHPPPQSARVSTARLAGTPPRRLLLERTIVCHCQDST